MFLLFCCYLDKVLNAESGEITFKHPIYQNENGEDINLVVYFTEWASSRNPECNKSKNNQNKNVRQKQIYENKNKEAQKNNGKIKKMFFCNFVLNRLF